MKKLLLIISLGAMAATAEPLVSGGVSASGQAAVASYNAIEVCMQELAASFSRIQDSNTAATEAPAVLRIGQELKSLLDNMEDPYFMGKKAVTKADKAALADCHYRMKMTGLAVQREILRLVKVKFYHSEPLIKALQELEMLDSATDALIRR